MAGRKPWIDDYTIKDAKIRWRNFAGREERFNAKGDRNFTIFLEPHDAERLSDLGLNVKTLPPREEGQPGQDILKVKVNFKGRPPRLVMVTHRGRTQLDEESAQMLDFAEIEKVDLIISPYYWENNGKEGVAVSLKAIYMTIVEDELEMAYGDLPEASSALRSFDYTPNEEEDTGVRFR
jgi:hypothetical protein